jgi:hypothetical protein
MHLCDRRGRQWLAVEASENRVDGFSVGGLQYRDGLFRGKRRHGVLQLGQLIGDVRRQQVAARRNRLAELDEYRPEFLEREADALALRCAAVPAPRREIEEKGT